MLKAYKNLVKSQGKQTKKTERQKEERNSEREINKEGKA